jgi:hypothetical protein
VKILINISVLDIALRIEKELHLSFSFVLKEITNDLLETGMYRIITSDGIALFHRANALQMRASE